MKKIKKQIVQFVNRLLTHTKLYSQVEIVEKKLARQILLSYLLIPEILPLNIESKHIIESLNNNKQFEKSNLNISKNDLMFMFWLHQTSNLNQALQGYFSSGLNQALIVKSLLEKKFSELNTIQFLDFASGHGRISRFFGSFLPQKNITVCDVKENAVNFQQSVLGLKGFVVPDNPNSFKANETYDFILISSLFTHLKQELFCSWITTVCSLLNPSGILAFSIHQLENKNEESFHYVEISEDDLFPETADNLGGRSIYGFTQINKIALKRILDEHVGFKYELLEDTKWGDSQMLIMLKKQITIN